LASGGGGPLITRARAPTRLDLAGAWTDVPPYSGRQGGAVVTVAISLHAHAVVRRRRGGVRLHALDYGATVGARRASELPTGGDLALLTAAAKRLGPRGEFELTTRADYPPGSGLGGSGAMSVAVVAALAAARGKSPLPAEIAQVAHRLETVDAKIAGGKQDQYSAALGGVQFLEFADPAVRATRLDLAPACLHDLEQHLVLCYVGASRFSGGTIARVMGRYEAGDAAVAAALDGLKGCALRMREVLLRGDVGAVGEVLAENWRHQRALDPAMETTAMRRLADAAAHLGVRGWKACGSGAGGCLVILARPGEEHALGEALQAAGGTILRYTFDAVGVEAWKSQER
jgi:D-glycero-alpha-D-manno-heptose-7-phosphate kinase